MLVDSDFLKRSSLLLRLEKGTCDPFRTIAVKCVVIVCSVIVRRLLRSLVVTKTPQGRIPLRSLLNGEEDRHKTSSVS